MKPHMTRMAGVQEKRALVRTRTFTLYAAEEVIAILRCEKFTGNMTLNFSQGTVNAMHVEDRQLPDPNQNNKT